MILIFYFCQDSDMVSASAVHVSVVQKKSRTPKLKPVHQKETSAEKG